MSIFDSVTACKLTNAHGEVNLFRIVAGNLDLAEFTAVKPTDGAYVVGHSESGHHHLLEGDGVIMMERTLDGMKILHAILDTPASLRQAAGAPHKEQIVEPGEYFITNNVEYNPFLEQVRRAAD